MDLPVINSKPPKKTLTDCFNELYIDLVKTHKQVGYPESKKAENNRLTGY